MGYYVETGASRGKAAALSAAGGSIVGHGDPVEELVIDPNDNEALVCVVDNGPFEAAAIAFSTDEARAFCDPRDRRPKTWVAIEKETLKTTFGVDIEGIPWGANERG